MKYDRELDIAVGRSRTEKKWQNKKMLWSDFVDQVRETHRTAETHNEYMAAKKVRQDEIKDVGGFVGGYLSQGARKADTVLHRSVVSLDIDHAKDTEVLNTLDMLYGCAAVLYSTHKHTPETPKLRLIIPLDADVFCEEYEAIARRIAGDLGINDFDDTTFQPSRLMYWPSTSKDAEYVFEVTDAPLIDTQKVLESYGGNWRDSSTWPISDRVNGLIDRSIKKQGDPLDKPGLVGAFCRSYSIADAIEKFLQDDYEACDLENRFTYLHGSTTGGLVVYDDKFAFSHHGTDPSSSKLCNAFDLVRLHKFGLKDEDAKDNTPGNKLPSYKSMVEFASKDENVRRLIGIENYEKAKAEFDDGYVDGEPEEEIDLAWLGDLEVDKRGIYQSTINNVDLILRNDPRLRGKFSHNVFTNKSVALDDLPWRKINPNDNELKDIDDSGIRSYLEKYYGITGTNKIYDALMLHIQDNSFHPVKDFFKTLEWDGVKRVDTLFIDYLGAEDSEYTREVTRKALVACVARIKNPGCKYDYVLTLIGKQGIGKSTILKKLGGDWFSDSFTTVQGKEAVEQIQGRWIIEVAELSGLKKAEAEHIKHFMSKQSDSHRPAYGKRTETYLRQCVFFGTTNSKDFLTDVTGNRRFWAVDTDSDSEPSKNIFTELGDYEVRQVWAEALELYKSGEKLYLSAKIEEAAREIQKRHTVIDDRAGAIMEYLDMPITANWYDMPIEERINFLNGSPTFEEEATKRREIISVAEIWTECFRKPKGDLDRRNSMSIHAIMKSIDGWENYKSKGGLTTIKGYGKQRAYRMEQSMEQSLK